MVKVFGEETGNWEMEVVVTILIKKKLKVKELKLPPPPEVELIAVKINTLRNIIVATLYMPPRRSTWDTEYTYLGENTI